MKNILTIDVEEIFHTEYAKQGTLKRDFKTPSNLPRVIELLETYGAKATFFILGEIAEIFPGILEEIRGGGHEVAFHGYDHEPLWRLTEEKFKGEIEGFDQLLRRSLGERCIGFRAPSLSLNNDTRWALKVLADAGYRYDSSIIPAKTPLYGSP
ncbi:MAG: polysaccharide deacetylase family protein, partial [Candidatus Geothermarchaeales archaeon]